MIRMQSGAVPVLLPPPTCHLCTVLVILTSTLVTISSQQPQPSDEEYLQQFLQAYYEYRNRTFTVATTTTTSRTTFSQLAATQLYPNDHIQYKLDNEDHEFDLRQIVPTRHTGTMDNVRRVTVVPDGPSTTSKAISNQSQTPGAYEHLRYLLLGIEPTTTTSDAFNNFNQRRFAPTRPAVRFASATTALTRAVTTTTTTTTVAPQQSSWATTFASTTSAELAEIWRRIALAAMAEAARRRRDEEEKEQMQGLSEDEYDEMVLRADEKHKENELKKTLNSEVLAVQQRHVRQLSQGQKINVQAVSNNRKYPRLSVSHSTQAARRRAFIQRLDQSVQAFMNKYGIEGVSVAIAVPKGVKVERAYGWANTERRERLTEHHMLRVASLSKPLTSAACLKLMEMGLLNLDEPVFGPDGVLGTLFGVRPYNQYVKMITVRHMLEHSAGWPSNPASIDPVMQHVQLSREQLIGWVLDNLPLTRPPGTVFQYSNFCYLVLGRIIEARAREPYEQFVRRHILSPCGAGNMTNQQFLPGREPMYYSSEESPYTFPLQRADSALGWVTAPADYLRFMLCIDGWPQVRDILSKQSIERMTTASRVHDAYGLGWSFNHMHDWWHSGSMPGTTAYVEKYRTGLMWVILTNRRHEFRFANARAPDALGHDAESALLQFESDLSKVINRDLF